MVVDDNEFSAHSLKKILTHFKLECDVSYNGYDAL